MATRGGKQGKAKSKLARQRQLEQEERERKAQEEARARAEEEERHHREEQERVQQEEEERVRREEGERFKEEEEAANRRMNRWEKRLAEQIAKAMEEEEWQRYLVRHEACDAWDERDVNSFIHSLGEDTTPQSLSDAMRTLQLCVEVLKDLKSYAWRAVGLGDQEKAATFVDFQWRLRAAAQGVLDRATADFLQFVDTAFINREREEGREARDIKADLKFQIVQVSQDDVRLGIWANLAKNPRLKSVEFPEVGVTAHLPKTLVLASVAIRLLQCDVDLVSWENTGDLYPVGRILFVELLQLPPQGRRVRGWIMHQITELSHSVKHVEYPASTDASTSGTVPQGASLAVTFHIPDRVVVDETPAVGWWSESLHAWQTDHISDVRFDSETRQVTFQAHHFGNTAFALVKSRSTFIPYDSWQLRSTGIHTVVLSIDLPVPPKRLDIVVEETKCSLVNAIDGSLGELVGQWLDPWDLLTCLVWSGVLITAASPDDQYSPNLWQVTADASHSDPESDGNSQTQSHKDEHATYMEVARILPTVHLASSRWNVDTEGSHFVFRAQDAFPEGDHDASDWMTLLCKDHKAGRVEAHEGEDGFSDVRPEGKHRHYDVYTALSLELSEKSRSLLEATSPHFQHTVALLLSFVRPLRRK